MGGALEEPQGTVSDLSHSTPTPAGPGPSFQAGNHTLCLEGQETPGGRKGLWTVAKKETIPKALGARAPPPPLPQQPIPQTSLPSIPSWVVQSRQQEVWAQGRGGGGRTSPPLTTHGAAPCRGGPACSPSHSLGMGNATVLGQDWDPPPLPQLGPSQPQLPHSRLGRGAPPKHSPPGSCCSAGWNGESRCVPGTPASALRQPLSCGDRKGTIEGAKTRAAGSWELGLWGPQIHARRGKARLWKEKNPATGQENPGSRMHRSQHGCPQGCGRHITPFPLPSTDKGGRGLRLGSAWGSLIPALSSSHQDRLPDLQKGLHVLI